MCGTAKPISSSFSRSNVTLRLYAPTSKCDNLGARPNRSQNKSTILYKMVVTVVSFAISKQQHRIPITYFSGESNPEASAASVAASCEKSKHDKLVKITHTHTHMTVLQFERTCSELVKIFDLSQVSQHFSSTGI